MTNYDLKLTVDFLSHIYDYVIIFLSHNWIYHHFDFLCHNSDLLKREKKKVLSGGNGLPYIFPFASIGKILFNLTIFFAYPSAYETFYCSSDTNGNTWIAAVCWKG